MKYSDEDLVSAAAEIGRSLPERNIEIEKNREIPVDIISSLRRAGIFHALVPKIYGGSEVHPAALIKIIRLVAEGDGAVGWNVMIGTTTGLLAASMPEIEARKIYGSEPGVLTVGVTVPAGRAALVDGGYIVNGRWPFGSGSRHAEWVCGGCTVIERDGKKRLAKNGVPEVQLMMFSKDQIELEDTWKVSGLKGTGSNHFSVRDQLVPLGRQVILGSVPENPEPLYRFPTLGLLALGVSAVSLGIGYRALRAFKELAADKVPTGTKEKLIENSLAQTAVAKATANLESSEAYMDKVVNDCFRVVADGESLSKENRNKLRLAAVNTTARSAEAVRFLYQAGGGSSIYEQSQLQRCFRDVHVTTQHIMVAPSIYEMTGKAEMEYDS
ncbi:MAG: acyl-CoA dehydrogenase [Gammaproteobacteria bacterium]|nr:acyl-CoA dehydrogenase [Gammaproteobacteria bacterium]